MKKLITVILISFLISFCSDSTSPTKINNLSFNQIEGCNNSTLTKIVSDSCFSYSRENNLKINFCLPANCCPDTNRFDHIFTTNNDTIMVIAIDTAAHLCRCTCDYMLEVNVEKTGNKPIQFICVYYDSLYYNEEIF